MLTNPPEVGDVIVAYEEPWDQYLIIVVDKSLDTDIYTVDVLNSRNGRHEQFGQEVCFSLDRFMGEVVVNLLEKTGRAEWESWKAGERKLSW